nr:acyltransferase family protein [Treponema sp.]
MDRQRNIDLLRIVSIFFITMHHLTINGIFNLDALSNGAYPTERLEITFFASMLNAFLVVGVNIFFLISGYFQIKLSIKKIFFLIIYIALFYGILNLTNSIYTHKKIDFHFFTSTIMSLRRYWFVNVYILLSLASPFLNKLLETSSKLEIQNFFIGILIVCCGYYTFISNNDGGINKGYSLVSAIYLYIIGGEFNRIGIDENKIKTAKLLFQLALAYVCNCLLVFITLFLLKAPKRTWNLFSYTNPFVFAQSIIIFTIFTSIHVNKKVFKLIDFFTPAILFCYIIQSSGFAIIKDNRDFLINFSYEKFGAVTGLFSIPINAILIVLFCTFCYNSKPET